MANRKLLFIAYYMPPMGSSGVQRPFNLLKKLPAMGWDPIVLCPETGLYHTLDVSLSEQFEALNIPVFRVKAKTPFHLLGNQAKEIKPSSEKISKILRWISAFFFLPDNKRGWIKPALVTGEMIIKEFKPDLILATSPPPSNLIIASKLAGTFDIPLVFDMRDDWLDNHQQVYPSFLHKEAMAKIERKILPSADAIVSVNKVIHSSIQRRYPSSKATFYSIPSGFDPGVFSKNVRPSLEKEEGTLTLLYSGRFYGENQPDVLIRALVTLFKLMPDLKDRVRLAFQGGLEARHHQLFTLMGLNDIIIDLGYVEHDVAVSNLLQADALWVIAAHSQNGAQVSTGKVTEYFGSGKPILALAPPKGALATLVSEYGPSYQADPSSDESIQEALTHLFGDLMDGTLKPLNKAYIDTFTIDSMASSFVAVLNRTAQLKKVKDA